jgi:3-hydroxybutyryl-CoA dehydratase
MPTLAIGQKAQVSRRFTLAEVTALAKLVEEDWESEKLDVKGESSPQEVSADLGLAEATATNDLAIVVPRALLGGLFSYLLGTQLPGTGTIYLKQQLEFIAPAYCEEELTASVEIREIKPEKRLVTLDTQCTNAQGQLICQGSALVLANRE